MSQFTVPELPYSYSALQPAISEEIMKLHHDTHHVAYVAKLNEALTEVQTDVNLDHGDEQALKEVMRSLDALPESIRTAVRNNGGGHYNHSFFWKCMCSGGSQMPVALQGALEDRYGSIESFKDEFAKKALGLFGSGWVWLTSDLEIVTSPNQDNPIMEGGDAPILGLDVWEHAYYLDYGAARKDYVEAWWGVVDWEFVAQNYSV